MSIHLLRPTTRRGRRSASLSLEVVRVALSDERETSWGLELLAASREERSAARLDSSRRVSQACLAYRKRQVEV